MLEPTAPRNRPLPARRRRASKKIGRAFGPALKSSGDETKTCGGGFRTTPLYMASVTLA